MDFKFWNKIWDLQIEFRILNSLQHPNSSRKIFVWREALLTTSVPKVVPKYLQQYLYHGCGASCHSPSCDHPYCASEDQDQVIMSSHDSQSPPTWPPTNHVWPPTKLIQVHSLTYNILNIYDAEHYVLLCACMYVCMYDYTVSCAKKTVVYIYL